MKTTSITHKFVELIPDVIENRVIYISLSYSTAIHKCLCGCGNEVVTPFSPRDWKLIFEGEFISLDPSVGNWSFKCQSHYWIIRNKVRWCEKWSSRRIDVTRKMDQQKKDAYYKKK